jgi:hypothetical protein
MSLQNVHCLANPELQIGSVIRTPVGTKVEKQNVGIHHFENVMTVFINNLLDGVFGATLKEKFDLGRSTVLAVWRGHLQRMNLFQTNIYVRAVGQLFQLFLLNPRFIDNTVVSSSHFTA